ncbi:DNA N-4 cytosine methyltransferase M.NgoMXV [Klebsiella pneumoniae]|nr:DNA N-4 cytosine methyltransferase M.NgoMXV [Klebsiella pneumoniae]SBJ70166.1 DNA N-4 cytosine methyltransferase M.NgoMXV [Klebsiella pneumoniae]SVQ95079.1 DNA N-4 cytosine methyltransferase M.NgoMXV [Klebsiella pneumoniae]VGL06598.1 DNA N-4 cytosine methyltransferase M.NgoMXV [Klebsiella pneumoniae]VGL40347.1 DNA N-4 cytosine methyltransferase M.NgoMXV [Klebsiella pneumoniae]
MSEQTILDMCCGSHIFWFGKEEERIVCCETTLYRIVSV